MIHGSEVKYRIGQVVKHTKYGLHGVIIGWDSTAKAPEDWIEQNYSQEDV